MSPGLQSRVRSHPAVSAMDTSGANGASCQTSPENSPVSGAWNREQPCNPPDTYVHVRRVSYGRFPPAHKLGPAPSLIRSVSPLHRRLMLFVMGGLIAGCLLHGFVLWRGIAHHIGPYAPATRTGALIPGIRDGLHTHESAASRGIRTAPTKPPSPKMTNPTVKYPQLTLTEAQKLGMPGDSDRLPGQPVWDASKWNFTKKIDPESNDWPNSLAICAIMKGEHPDDVVQWLKYHLCVPCPLYPRLSPCTQVHFSLELASFSATSHSHTSHCCML